MNITKTKHIVADSSITLDERIEKAIKAEFEDFEVAGIKYSCVLLSGIENIVQYSALIIFHR